MGPGVGRGDALALGLGAAAAAAAGQAAEAADDHEDLALAAATPIGPLGLYSNCPNACCTGAFVQETMSGIIMSADLHELIFTNETVGTAKFGLSLKTFLCVLPVSSSFSQQLLGTSASLKNSSVYVNFSFHLDRLIH